jgi:hypothetical protein
MEYGWVVEIEILAEVEELSLGRAWKAALEKVKDDVLRQNIKYEMREKRLSSNYSMGSIYHFEQESKKILEVNYA